MKTLRTVFGTVLGTVVLLLAAGAGEMAAQAAAPQPGAAGSGASVRQPRRSWTADRREFVVGDVITVLLDEYTLASAAKTNVASDRRSRDLDVQAAGRVGDTSLPPVAVGVGSINDADSRQIGDAHRQNRFQGEMTVRVTEIEEGLLRVEGRKLINLDKHEQEMALSGFVRAEDISSGNLVDSWRIADVELVYTSKGGKPSGGILTRLLGALWP